MFKTWIPCETVAVQVFSLRRAGYLACVLSGLFGAGARAQNADQDDGQSNLYLSLMGGANWNNPVDWRNDASIGRFGSKTGYALIGAIGWKTANNLRFELEPGYRFNRQRYSVQDGVAQPAGGRVSNESLMANVLFDIPTNWALKPYIGAGVGVSQVRARLDSVTVGGLPVVLQDKDTVIAYQAIVGIGFQVTRNLFMTVDYRYFASRDPFFTPAVGGPWTAQNHNHAVMVGVRMPFSI